MKVRSGPFWVVGTSKMVSVASAGTRTMRIALSGGALTAPGWARSAPATRQGTAAMSKICIDCFMESLPSNRCRLDRKFTRLVRLNPLHRLWVDLVGGTVARVRSAAAGQAADGAYRHVVVAQDLAAQANAGDAARRQHVALGG